LDVHILAIAIFKKSQKMGCIAPHLLAYKVEVSDLIDR
jgi:hypothetical protein